MVFPSKKNSLNKGLLWLSSHFRISPHPRQNNQVVRVPNQGTPPSPSRPQPKPSDPCSMQSKVVSLFHLLWSSLQQGLMVLLPIQEFLHPRLNGITPNHPNGTGPSWDPLPSLAQDLPLPATMTTLGSFPNSLAQWYLPQKTSTSHQVMAPPIMTQMAQRPLPSSPDKMVSPSQDLLPSMPNVIITHPWVPRTHPRVSSPLGLGKISPTL